jgi:predicted phosphodiesterase
MANTPEGAKRSGLTRAKESLLGKVSTGEKAATVLSPEESIALLLIRELGLEEGMRRLRDSPAPPPLEFDEIELPESHARELPKTHRPKQESGVFAVLGDTHIPYQDNQAIKTAVKIMRHHGVTGICLNGDVADFYQASKYVREPGRRSLKQEIDTVCAFLKALRGYFLEAEIVYQSGNHDDRLAKWVLRNDGILWGIPQIEIPSLFDLESMGIRYAPTADMLNIGGLNVLHGDVLPGGGAINSARNLALKFMTPVAVNHWHIVDTYEPKSRVDGSENIAAYNVGCLCGKRADYAPKSTFQHGCMIVEYTPTEYKATNYLIDGAEYHEIRRK